MKWYPAWVLLGLLGLLATVAFDSPNREDRRQAAGDLRRLTPQLRRAFSEGSEFLPKKEPGAMDWLASHDEPGQGFDRYVRSKPNLPFAERKKLYILPARWL